MPKLQQTPYKTLQKSTKIKGRKFPKPPPYEPEKAFEFPLKFPYKINTFQRLAINNPHQRFQRTEKVGKKHLWSTKIKGRKIPELPPYEPEKAFEFPLKFPYKINTFKDSPSTILINDFKGPKKLGKNHLWTNSFTPWNFSPVFSANGS
jgi:hypothetical protein